MYPLRQAVLFPGVVLPLEVEERPGCELVADTVAGHGILVVAMIRPGRSADKPPPLCEVGCLSRIAHVQARPGGRYAVEIEGISRARLGDEVPSARGYRCFRARPCEDPSASELSATRRQWTMLHHCVRSIGDIAAATDHDLVEILQTTRDPLELADLLAAVLVPDPGVQQQLLACLQLPARLALLIDCMVDALARLGTPPARLPGNGNN